MKKLHSDDLHYLNEYEQLCPNKYWCNFWTYFANSILNRFSDKAWHVFILTLFTLLSSCSCLCRFFSGTFTNWPSRVLTLTPGPQSVRVTSPYVCIITVGNNLYLLQLVHSGKQWARRLSSPTRSALVICICLSLAFGNIQHCTKVLATLIFYR